VRVLVVGCYELGHQPLQVAAAAGHLRAAGHDVRAVDLAVEDWDADLAAWADRVAVAVPMHTASRIARRAIASIRAIRPATPICAYGLYASMLDDVADRVITGETDAALVAWVAGGDDDCVVHLGRDAASPGAPLPARDLLPPLDRYAKLAVGVEERPAGYVEASHGCVHRCRHCPVPVVYDGRIRIVSVDDVLADVTQQAAAGAVHLTFGDPDFLNGVHHSLRVARAVHERFPAMTFDCTVKVEHILRHADVWAELRDLGCLFVVSAFESTDDAVLARLDKGHTVADAAAAVAVLRAHDLAVRPTWLPFTPWTTLADVRSLLRFVAEHDLVEHVDPVQYTIRLLIPRGSLVLGLSDLAVGPYDDDLGAHPWRNPDPAVDRLHAEIADVVERRLAEGAPTVDVYRAVCGAAGFEPPDVGAARAVPRLTEPWFCCAEPTARQLGALDPV
jgi:radical SAM superfamily enzyme YgiQ (UPF0313 family)